MCGFVGFVSSNNSVGEEDLLSMTGSLRHRGPDDCGIKCFNMPRAKVGFGHQRLSILDLRQLGKQPMSSDNQRYEIVFNGEIYNFQEIKQQLCTDGYSFKSNTDTEVILNAYDKWGIDCVKKFIGMFAFAILDRIKRVIYLVRDRVGVKPLYYFNYKGHFCFASELKAITKHPYFHREVCPESVAMFFKQNLLAPYSIYKNTHKVHPGHYIKFKIDNFEQENTQYWDLVSFYNHEKLDISYNETIERAEELMISACQYRMVSDVPVGIFLSGGYDSAAITALLSNDRSENTKTYTIGFENHKYNGLYAREVSQHLGTDHTEYYCTEEDMMNILPDLPHTFDEPFSDTSAIPTLLVSKVARKQVSVALSADGGDEIFGGYNKYIHNIGLIKLAYKYRNFLRLPVEVLAKVKIPLLYREKIHQLLDAIQADNISIVAQKRVQSDYIRYADANELLNVDFHPKFVTAYDDAVLFNEDNALQDIMMGLDYKTYLVDDVLVKVDRATMSCGLEGREPLLDHRLVEFMATIPFEHKFRNGRKKAILKDIVHKYLPEHLMDRPKKGFGIPFYEWFGHGKNDCVQHYLSPDIINKHGILDAKVVTQLSKQYDQVQNPRTQSRLWSAFIFSQWCETWL